MGISCLIFGGSSSGLFSVPSEKHTCNFHPENTVSNGVYLETSLLWGLPGACQASLGCLQGQTSTTTLLGLGMASGLACSMKRALCHNPRDTKNHVSQEVVRLGKKEEQKTEKKESPDLFETLPELCYLSFQYVLRL